ncbi:MAG: hypothetical protein GY832_16960 [Chloroflexi bacterium]|nr:hypothetical protein [Chloroflexota bacterium]
MLCFLGPGAMGCGGGVGVGVLWFGDCERCDEKRYPQINTRSIGLTYPITSAPDATPVRSLAVSPWSAQAAQCLVSPWCRGDEMRGGELAVRCVVCDHKRGGDHCCLVGLVVVIGGLWVVTLVPAPSLATAETEGQSLGFSSLSPRARTW